MRGFIVLVMVLALLTTFITGHDADAASLEYNINVKVNSELVSFSD
ncbi:hypothetical protein [Desulfoscipio geothermicus]|uniref:Uncharacterized protein n=1 Tax=Desulfoscipio geothermicus DSM 3669 TaxID=1121426 RepID=A0A1I6E1X4_9FIRM|nr:hypothetical protein [Desulfoscipio geothermicus]SFR11774.1 hypothetical protein SAMN05660706_12364 [Desulfoscipio geothermicus DSM 3669]